MSAASEISRAVDLESIDSDQPARVLWWANGELPTEREGPIWGSDRFFSSLRDAINFVANELSDSERSTAIITFGSPPYKIDSKDANAMS
jgi:hypothetical protein